MTRAMVLAAGLGTRLGALSDELPKPLVPICDVPLIRYPLTLLAGHGVKDVVINLHHKGTLLEEELGVGADMGLRIAYSREDKILGTGGAIRRALPMLGDQPFLVVNGKILIDVDIDDLLARHEASGARVTLVVRRDPDARRWGAIDAPPAGGPLRGLLGEGEFMFTGVSVIDPALIARWPDDGEARCLVRQGLVPWLAEGVPIHAYVYDGYFMEHSTPERYLQGNINVLDGTAVLRFPPRPLTGVDPSVFVDETALLLAPLCVGPGALVGEKAVLGPDVVVGNNSLIAPGVKLSRVVVWAKTVVNESARDCIITPQGTVSAVGTS